MVLNACRKNSRKISQRKVRFPHFTQTSVWPTPVNYDSVCKHNAMLRETNKKKLIQNIHPELL